MALVDNGLGSGDTLPGLFFASGFLPGMVKTIRSLIVNVNIFFQPDENNFRLVDRMGSCLRA